MSVSGSCTDIRNSANWSTPIPPLGAAVQVTDRTVPDAASRSSLAVHPGMASVRADATSGRVTVSAVVAAPLSDSLGTWKVTIAMAPRTALSLLAWTCAHAGGVAADAEVERGGGGDRDQDARNPPVAEWHVRPLLSGQPEPGHQVRLDAVELRRDRARAPRGAARPACSPRR